VALVRPFVLQLVGYKNSGKTTFTNKLINQLTACGLKVVTIKHHGHGGKPSVVEETDSAQHMKSGAIASIVEGDGRILLQIDDMEWSLQKKIEMLSVVDPDIILVEGYKYESYEKVVFIRDHDDLHLLQELKYIELVIFKDKMDVDFPYPSFHREDPQAIQWLVDYLETQ